MGSTTAGQMPFVFAVADLVAVRAHTELCQVEAMFLVHSFSVVLRIYLILCGYFYLFLLLICCII